MKGLATVRLIIADTLCSADCDRQLLGSIFSVKMSQCPATLGSHRESLIRAETSSVKGTGPGFEQVCSCDGAIVTTETGLLWRS